MEEIHLLHIPRTGGSAVKYALRKGYCGKPHVNINISTSDYKILINGHGQTMPDANMIFMVRDPAERFASGFCSRFFRGGALYYGPWTKEETKAFGLFTTPNELAEALSEKGKMREYAEYAMTNIQHVFTSYWDWFFDERKLLMNMDRIMWVGRTEHLTDDFKDLKDILKLDDSYELPKDSVQRSHIDMSGKKLSEKGLRNIKKWYELDYYFIDILKSNGKI